MNITYQNTHVSKRMNNQFVTDSKTGEKELSINILLRGMAQNKQSTKAAFSLSDTKRFDILDLNPVKNIFLTVADESKLDFDCHEFTWQTDEDGYLNWNFAKRCSHTSFRLQQRINFNERINEILRKSGIEISENDKFIFEVDFYKNIRVIGQDSEKAKAIEIALNEGNDRNDRNALGRWLAGSVHSGIIGNVDKYFGENYKLFDGASQGLRIYLNLELDDLIQHDNGIFTPDGVPLKEALQNSERIKEMGKDCAINAFHAVDVTMEKVTKAFALGIEKISTFPPAKIEFGSNGLIDLYQPEFGFGHGQTWWMEKYNVNNFSREEIIAHHFKMIEFENSTFR